MARKLVSVVDDDQSVREALPPLLESFGLEVLSFASAEEFLGSGDVDRTDCLILDIAMPGMTGTALRQHLASSHADIAIIFITAHSDEADAALIRDQTACLIKPFSAAVLWDAVRAALGEGEVIP